MAQTKQLIDTLKRALKAQGLSYADVAKELNLSEASVKRLFSQSGFSLAQLAREFDSLNQNDASLSLSQRGGTTVVLAMRNWRLGLFDSFRK